MTAAFDIGNFSVCQVFEGGACEWVRLGVSAKGAVEAARHYSNSLGAQLGVVQKVMITDDDDYCVYCWTREDGITFPPVCGGME